MVNIITAASAAIEGCEEIEGLGNIRTRYQFAAPAVNVTANQAFSIIRIRHLVIKGLLGDCSTSRGAGADAYYKTQ